MQETSVYAGAARNLVVMELMYRASPCANNPVVMRAVDCAAHSWQFAAPAWWADLHVQGAAARRSPGVLRKVDAELRRHPEVARATLGGRDRSQIALSF